MRLRKRRLRGRFRLESHTRNKENELTTTTTSTDTPWAAPGDENYRQATSALNLAAHVLPALAATATSVDEVRRLLADARERGVGVRMHSTGHAADGGAAFGGAALIRLKLDGGVVVDASESTATIPAGTTWGEVVEATAPLGLAPLHGSSPDVGAIGYLLRGGMSFYGRRYGVASNSIRSIDIVLADGSLVTVDHTRDPELFWALRGGGGGFGIVVSATVSLVPVENVYTGAAFWPLADAPALLQAWENWCATAPNAASTSFRIMSLPPIPGLPPALSAGPVVCNDGAVIDDDGRRAVDIADELLVPMRTYTAPLFDTWHTGTAADVATTHMDPPTPIPYRGDHLVVSPLGDDGRRALLDIAGQADGSALAIVELRQLGGAFAHADPLGGAFSAVQGAYALVTVGLALGPNTVEVIAAQQAGLRSALAPWNTGMTVPSAVERHDAPQKTFDTATAERVDSIRRRVDPHGVFRSDRAPGAAI